MDITSLGGRWEKADAEETPCKSTQCCGNDFKRIVALRKTAFTEMRRFVGEEHLRIESFLLKDINGLVHVEVSGLSDVVVLAGPNGVGKTRILRQLIDFFRKPRRDTGIQIRVEATSPLEARVWGNQKVLNTTDDADAGKLRTILQRSQRRNQY
jgi:ABC-type ATPase with predicted acetyltransferase domain